jgi:ABC-2 type transport system ATP-binding protein
MQALLAAQQLEKRYLPEDVLAVDGVSFEIQAGEIFSLLGPNGAGKTTTISMLSTLIEPTGGDAIVAGSSIRNDPMGVKAVLGVVPQEIALYEDLTARQNLQFWGQMYGLGGGELRSRMEAVLEQVSLSDRAGDRVRSYSGGMKRRLNIAVGLLHKPQVLFMDEPTVGIDPQSRRKILDTVKDLNREGLTVLYTTHYMEEAEELSDRVGIMDHGKLIALGTQKELTEMVGENESLVLHLQEGDSGAPLAERLHGLPGVLDVSSVNGEVILVVTEAEEALPAVMVAAGETDVRIRSIEIREPNLEAVFLHLTGRALRD